MGICLKLYTKLKNREKVEFLPIHRVFTGLSQQNHTVIHRKKWINREKCGKTRPIIYRRERNSPQLGFIFFFKTSMVEARDSLVFKSAAIFSIPWRMVV